ncbi:MAG: VWA domain-containing protein [Crocinitomicaceae bacterium]
MYKLLLAISLFFFCFQSEAQITASVKEFNFGDLYSGSQTYTDITFTNNSDKTQFLLTLDKPRDVYYIFSGKTLLPDSSIVIRLKINENKTGKFNYPVSIYFSEPREPIEIVLKGNVKESSSYNAMTACPDFNSSPPTSYSTAFDVVVRVIDSLSREPIKNATVYLVENGELIGEYSTNNKGIVKERIPLGYYYITAQKTPYNSNFHEGYLNFKRNYVEIELNKDPVIEPEIEIVEEQPPVEEEPEEYIEIEIEEETEEETEETVTYTPPPIEESTTPAVEPTALESLPDTVFTPDYFKYNNITFILDVSSSMNGMGKLSLMKMCMIELTKVLRPNDMVSMIKYSEESDIILKQTPGDEKETIINAVKDLIGRGLTAGGNAIKAGYRLNRRSYIDDGNNIVIMITDGVFNRGDKDYLATIQKYYQSKGVRFSVVGIKTSDFITQHMMAIVKEGGGDFVRILNVEDAQTKLINEIRRTSFKF